MEGWREGGLRLQAESLGQTLWLGLRLQVRGLGVQRLRLLSPFNPGGGRPCRGLGWATPAWSEWVGSSR